MNIAKTNYLWEWIEQKKDSKVWNVTKQTSSDLFFSLSDILWAYDIDQWNYFVIKDILNKDKTPNKNKLWITIIRAEEKLIETVVIDINSNEYENFKKWKWSTLHL